MAQYEEKNQLDYRQGGDTVDDFAQKYMAEITRIFRFLNDLRSNTTNTVEYTEPVANQLKVEDGKLYIRNAANDAWILLGEVDTNFGFKPADATFISTDDLSAEKIDNINALDFGAIVTNNDVAEATGTAGKLVKTNTDGLLDADITGNAGKLAGIRVASDIIQDGQVLTYRSATNTWTNENKGVIGSGKALNLYDGDTLLCSYVGDETRDFDLGITANKEYADTKADEAKQYAIDTVDGKADKATTLAGYGITDANITDGVVTLGDKIITPLTEHQDISGKADIASPTFTGTVTIPTLSVTTTLNIPGGSIYIS